MIQVQFKPKYVIPYNKTLASEYSDRVLSLNKFEERNLEVRLKQMGRENSITLHMIKREIDRLRKDYDTNQDRIELIRKQRQQLYDEKMRKYLESTKTKSSNLDMMHIYNTSRNLGAFYNISSVKQPVQQPQQQIKTQLAEQSSQYKPLIKRSPSRLSARNRVLLNTKQRACHSSYAKTATSPVKLDARLVTTGSEVKYALQLRNNQVNQTFVNDVNPKLKSRATSFDLNSVATLLDNDNDSLCSDDIYYETLDTTRTPTGSRPTTGKNKLQEMKKIEECYSSGSSYLSRKSNSAPVASRRRIEFHLDEKN